MGRKPRIPGQIYSIRLHLCRGRCLTKSQPVNAARDDGHRQGQGGFNYSFRGTDADGPMAFFGGGLGFPDHFTTAAVHYANIGGGYRIRLSSLWDIDFLATFRLCDDHPPVRDPESGEYVNESNIRKNVTAYCSLALGVAITL